MAPNDVSGPQKTGAEMSDASTGASIKASLLATVKYPVLAFSLAGAILLLKHYGVGVSEVSTSGVKLDDVKKTADDAKKATEGIQGVQTTHTNQVRLILERAQATGLEVQRAFDDLKQLEQRVARLEGGRRPGKNDTKRTEAGPDALESSTLFTDELAALSQPVEGRSGNPTQNKDGYLWIGNAAPGELLNSPILGDLSSPAEASVNSKLKVDKNVALRSSMPAPSESRYRGQSFLGVVPKGATVLVLEKPKEVRRDALHQWWVKVRVE